MYTKPEDKRKSDFNKLTFILSSIVTMQITPEKANGSQWTGLGFDRFYEFYARHTWQPAVRKRSEKLLYLGRVGPVGPKAALWDLNINSLLLLLWHFSGTVSFNKKKYWLNYWRRLNDKVMTVPWQSHDLFRFGEKSSIFRISDCKMMARENNMAAICLHSRENLS